MQFLMLATTIKGFMAAGTPLVGLHMAVGTDELVRSDVTHGDFFNTGEYLYLKIHVY